MSKLIIDAVDNNIFLMIISNDNIYNITHKNSKTNYDNLMVLIENFLLSKSLKLKDLRTLYINRGPGSFAGIRNSLSTAKALHLTMGIDYYCYSFKDFREENGVKHENIPNLCDKFNLKKNLINPVYIS